MSKKYTEIIEELERAVSNIESKGISIAPLNKAIEELKSHSQNINAVEENIEAVKSEVITPIKKELDENKKAGKFSIWGFYVGAFGLIVTAISLLYTSFDKPNKLTTSKIAIENEGINTKASLSKGNSIEFDNKLTEIIYELKGLNDVYKPKSDEIKIAQLDLADILKSDSNIFSIKAYILGEKLVGKKFYPMVSLNFFSNEKKLGFKGVKEMISLSNESGVSYYNFDLTSIVVTEGDSFVVLGKHRYKVIRIFRDESQILTVADKENAVLIKRIE